jgi:hypothetical protein
VQVSRTPVSRNHPRSDDRRPRRAKQRNSGPERARFHRRGDLRSVSVSFQEFGTMNALEFNGLIGRGERAPPALRSGSARWRRSQGVGGASWRKRRRRWLTVSRVAVDNAISTMTYRSLSRGSGGRLVLRLASPRDRLDDKHAAAAAGTRVRERGWLIVAGDIILVGFVGARRIAAMPRWRRRQNKVRGGGSPDPGGSKFISMFTLN